MEIHEKLASLCSLCNLKCASKSQLELHIRKHTREQPFFCVECARKFSKKGNLQRHVYFVHGGQKTGLKNNFKCSSCSFVTPWKSSLKKHQLKHTEERSFPCHHQNCGHAAKSSYCLRMHYLSRHKNERTFLCEFLNCGYRGNTKSDMRQHSQKHSDFKAFVCDFTGCSYRAKRRAHLNNHKRGVHNGGYKPFACSICSHCTTSIRSLNAHMLTHLEEKALKCKFNGCKFFCKSKKHLKDHVLRRHAERTFNCDFAGCTSTAASRSNLTEHKKNVHCEKIFKCSNCDYRAAQPSVLKKHLKVHGRNQRILCPHHGCTFQARYRSALNKHLEFHKANLACPMEGCGYVWHTSSSRKRHMQLHDPTGRPFQCPLCPQCFIVRTSLVAHLPSHTAEKPFKCPLCNYGSSSKCDVRRHVLKIHSILFSKFESDEESMCDHCHVNFGCGFSLAIHKIKLKTAVVVLTRLQFE